MATPVRGMSTRAVQAEQTRQQILETAQRLFAELGYDATSLQMIADEMGLTKAAVYYHFRAKSDILHAAMLPGIQRLAGSPGRSGRDPRAAGPDRAPGQRLRRLPRPEPPHYAAMASTDPAAKRNKLDGEQTTLRPACPHPAVRR